MKRLRQECNFKKSKKVLDIAVSAVILFDMTEQDLRNMGIGKVILPREHGWDAKRRCYVKEEVWGTFVKLRTSFQPCVTDETGHVFHALACKIAQKQIDTYLLLRVLGKPVSLPLPHGFVPEAKISEPTKLYDIKDFGELPKRVDLIRDWTWVYNHLDIMGVVPEDAPSPGAYGNLLWVQKNEKNREDFFVKILPKLAPSRSQIEDADKFSDDGRANFKLLDRLSAEVEAGAGDVPLL